MVFKKVKIALTEKNERILREIHQFVEKGIPFEVFVNNWIATQLYFGGFD